MKALMLKARLHPLAIGRLVAFGKGKGSGREAVKSQSWQLEWVSLEELLAARLSMERPGSEVSWSALSIDRGRRRPNLEKSSG
jgi:hypothetical protein